MRTRSTANAPLLHNFVREVELDSQGHVWLNNTNVQNQTTRTTIPLPDPNSFFELGGINCMDIGADGVLWFGTAEGTLSGGMARRSPPSTGRTLLCRRIS